jgi:hypothetical protein
MANDKETNSQAANVEAISSGISEVVHAALGVGAAVARTIAEATAAGKPVPPGAAGEGPFADIIHYGVQATSNVLSMVIRGIPSTAPRPGEAPGAGPVPAFPTVHAGSTLRIPLSIENPSDADMSQMTFCCRDLIYEGNAAGTPLTAAALVFEPATLSIAPRDFEKLTVFIATTEETATGSYMAKIAVEGGSFESVLRFEVVPAVQA